MSDDRSRSNLAIGCIAWRRRADQQLGACRYTENEVLRLVLARKYNRWSSECVDSALLLLRC